MTFIRYFGPCLKSRSGPSQLHRFSPVLLFMDAASIDHLKRLSGDWSDTRGSRYKVLLEEDHESCSVETKRPGGHPGKDRRTPGLIRLSPTCTIVFGTIFRLDLYHACTNDFNKLYWRNHQKGPGYHWTRNNVTQVMEKNTDDSEMIITNLHNHRSPEPEEHTRGGRHAVHNYVENDLVWARSRGEWLPARIWTVCADGEFVEVLWMEQWSKSRMHYLETFKRASNDYGWKSQRPFVPNEAVWAYFFGNWFRGKIRKMSYEEMWVEVLWEDELCTTRMGFSDLIPRSECQVGTTPSICA